MAITWSIFIRFWRSTTLKWMVSITKLYLILFRFGFFGPFLLQGGRPHNSHRQQWTQNLPQNVGTYPGHHLQHIAWNLKFAQAYWQFSKFNIFKFLRPWKFCFSPLVITFKFQKFISKNIGEDTADLKLIFGELRLKFVRTM